jgi:hypothetical protein
MRRLRKVTRRSFLSSVAGGAAAGALLTVSDNAAALQTGCTDTDPISRGGDPGGRGRNCANRPATGCSDSDPSDPGGRGRNCANRPQTGCSDTDPSDPSGRGTHCGTNTSQIGRSERRYEVCWVDHPSRSDDDCNWQTYSEWKITFADGHVEYDTAESMRRRAEMQARGYTARSHRMIVDW